MRAGAAVAAAAPIAGFPAVVKRRKPNEMLSHAAIGCGNQAWYDLNQLASHPDLNVTALCDVDSRYLENRRISAPTRRARTRSIASARSAVYASSFASRAPTSAA